MEPLPSSGLIALRTTGNRKHYRADCAAPAFEELRAIRLRTAGLVARCANLFPDASACRPNTMPRQPTHLGEVQLRVVEDAKPALAHSAHLELRHDFAGCRDDAQRGQG